MKTPIDTRLADEAARFSLRFACDDCVQFDPDRTPTCAHGWPLRLRRSALDRRVGVAAAAEDSVAFCKEFELA